MGIRMRSIWQWALVAVVMAVVARNAWANIESGTMYDQSLDGNCYVVVDDPAAWANEGTPFSEKQYVAMQFESGTNNVYGLRSNGTIEKFAWSAPGTLLAGGGPVGLTGHIMIGMCYCGTTCYLITQNNENGTLFTYIYSVVLNTAAVSNIARLTGIPPLASCGIGSDGTYLYSSVDNITNSDLYETSTVNGITTKVVTGMHRITAMSTYSNKLYVYDITNSWFATVITSDGTTEKVSANTGSGAKTVGALTVKP